jgi:hypothetical protein
MTAPRPEDVDALLEEQSTLTNLYVASDRLARATSATAALEIGVEILHNLAGVQRYAIWLDAGPGTDMSLVAPAEPRFRDGDHRELRDAAISRRQVARPPGGGPGSVPLALPLLLGGAVVGTLVVSELVPHEGDRLSPMQEDLLGLLGERLAQAMCDGALRARTDGGSAWASVAGSLVDLAER